MGHDRLSFPKGWSRVKGGSMSDGYGGREKIAAALAAGWVEVDLFERDFDRHQAYIGRFRDMLEWVKTNVGLGDVDWFTANNSWLFKDPQKAMLFKLTWAGL